jgi:tetratricopeptide (TPR) repeat protein
LYLGHLAEAQGHMYRSMKQYDVAEQYYNSAIKHHRIIKCPFGEGNNLLNLGENAFLQTDYTSALRHVNKASNLANRRELNSLKDQAKLALEKYSLPVNTSKN